MTLSINNSDRLALAKELDKHDPLAGYCSTFYQPGGKCYFDGNSLGLLNQQVEKAIINTLTIWKEKGIQGWVQKNSPWFTLAEEVSRAMQHSMGG